MSENKGDVCRLALSLHQYAPVRLLSIPVEGTFSRVEVLLRKGTSGTWEALLQEIGRTL